MFLRRDPLGEHRPACERCAPPACGRSTRTVAEAGVSASRWEPGHGGAHAVDSIWLIEPRERVPCRSTRKTGCCRCSHLSSGRLIWSGGGEAASRGSSRGMRPVTTGWRPTGRSTTATSGPGSWRACGSAGGVAGVARTTQQFLPMAGPFAGAAFLQCGQEGGHDARTRAGMARHSTTASAGVATQPVRAISSRGVMARARILEGP
jgi:hypothetical protein